MRTWDKPEARKQSQEPHDRRIHILRHEPKRAGSAAARRWRLLGDGMTIGQYYRAIEREDEDVRRARIDISYGVEAGLIELLPPLAR
jgi:hypothetical protein